MPNTPNPRTTRRRLEANWRLTEVERAEASPSTRLPWLPATVPSWKGL